MKQFLVLFVLLSLTMKEAFASRMCEVEVCNKLERITLSPSNWISDKLGESCFKVTLPEDQAVVGRTLSKETRWYQGSSINPTKKSVTRVKKVYNCS